MCYRHFRKRTFYFLSAAETRIKAKNSTQTASRAHRPGCRSLIGAWGLESLAVRSCTALSESSPAAKSGPSQGLKCRQRPPPGSCRMSFSCYGLFVERGPLKGASGVLELMQSRILIDATGVSIGGGYTFLVNVIPRLCERDPNLQVRVLTGDQIKDRVPSRPNLEVVGLPRMGVTQRLFYIFFHLPKLASEWRADLVFSLGEITPYRLPCPSIASFQNAFIFTPDVEVPNLHQRIRISLLRVFARVSISQAARIVFMSKASADTIGEQVGVPEERRAVLHHGIAMDTWASVEPPRDRPRPYILTVGSIYRYKNFVRLIEAYVQLAKRNPDSPDLVIIGDKFDTVHLAEMERARQASGPLRERIYILGAIPHAEIAAYYAGASLFVFPSYLETFGIPLLEAMAAGVPIVATDMASFREVAGDAAIFVDAFDVSAIARSMEEALRPEIAADLSRRGLSRVKDFSLERTVDQLSSIFQSVLGERS